MKSFLSAQSVQQIDCSSDGTDGTGNPLRSCGVLWTDSQNKQWSVTIEVDGTQVQDDQGIMTEVPAQ
jgi:hypothetical protein